MDEVKAVECWTEGFAKAAADQGITDPSQVDHLLKMCGRRAIMSKYSEAFKQGSEEVLEKQAIPLGLIGKGLMAILGTAGLAHGYEKGKQWLGEHGIGQDPSDAIMRQMEEPMSKALALRMGSQRATDRMSTFNKQMGGSSPVSYAPRSPSFLPLTSYGSPY